LVSKTGTRVKGGKTKLTKRKLEKKDNAQMGSGSKKNVQATKGKSSKGTRDKTKFKGRKNTERKASQDQREG